MNNYSHLLHFDTVIDALLHWSEHSPDKVAYTFLNDRGRLDTEITYRQLHWRVLAFAERLRQDGMEGARVAILLPPGLDYIVAFLGCLAGGAVAVPLYPPSSGARGGNRLEAVVGNCQPGMLVVNGSIAAHHAEELRALTALGNARACVIDSSEPVQAPAGPPPRRDRAALAFLQYTSGSTGNPKGVMVSHHNIIHNEYLIAMAMDNGADTVIVSWLPFYHDMGIIGNILQALTIGGHAVLMSPLAFLRNPLTWLRAISDYRGTMAGAPNFAFDLCVEKVSDADLATLNLSSWKTAFNGSEPIKISSLERFHHRFKPAGFTERALFPCYGLAEGTLYVSGGPLQDGLRTIELEREAISEGRWQASTLAASGADDPRVFSCVSLSDRWFDQRILVVDPASWTAVGADRIGEIWLSSASIAQGYWNNPQETAAVFHAYLADSGEGPFMRTGDLGFIADGQLFITGRIKELIIINGVNYYPQDIEHTVQGLSDNLRTHCGAAFNLDDDRLAVIQAVNRAKGAHGELQDMIVQIRQAVFQTHGVAPAYIALVNPGEIAKTSSGKIQRGVVRRRVGAGEMPVLASWSRNTPGQDYDQLLQGDITRKLAAARVPSPLAQEKMRWLRDYFLHRVDSFLIDERRTIPPYIVLDLGNQGLLGMQIPRRYGGLELSVGDFLSILELVAAKDLTLALFIGLNNVLGVWPLLRHGSDAMQAHYLPLLAAGRELAAFALTEPGAGSNPLAIQSCASEQPSGGYRIEGTKCWSGSAAWCGLLNVFANTTDRNGRVIGMTAFALPQASAGLRQGPEALTMGMRGMVQNTVLLEGVVAPRAQVLGRPGQGMQVAQDALCYGRLAIAATCVGGMKRCYQMMLAYAGQREIATGRLLDNSHTLAVLSETKHAITSIGALLDTAVQQLDQGRSVPPEVLAACKSVSTEWLWLAADRLMQMAGGRGYCENNFIPQLLRDARVLRIFEGPTETLDHFVGSSALKTPDTLRAYLLSAMSAAQVAQHFDSITAPLTASGMGEHDAAAANARCLGLGNYLSRLVVYCAAEPGADAAARRWLTRQLDEARQRLDQVPALLEQALPLEAIRRFGSEIGEQMGTWAQTCAYPDRAPDALLAGATVAPAADAGHAFAPQARVPDAMPAPQAAPTRAPASAQIESFLREWIGRSIKRPPASISPEVEFSSLGIGSIEAVELSAELSRRYGLELDATVLWNYPQITSLAAFVAAQLGPIRRLPHTEAATPA